MPRLAASALTAAAMRFSKPSLAAAATVYTHQWFEMMAIEVLMSK
jgi:hypothetical protein